MSPFTGTPPRKGAVQKDPLVSATEGSSFTIIYFILFCFHSFYLMKLKSHAIDHLFTIIAHRTISASNFHEFVLSFSSKENSLRRSSEKMEVESRCDSIEIERSREVIALSPVVRVFYCVCMLDSVFAAQEALNFVRAFSYGHPLTALNIFT